MEIKLQLQIQHTKKYPFSSIDCIVCNLSHFIVSIIIIIVVSFMLHIYFICFALRSGGQKKIIIILHGLRSAHTVFLYALPVYTLHSLSASLSLSIFLASIFLCMVLMHFNTICHLMKPFIFCVVFISTIFALIHSFTRLFLGIIQWHFFYMHFYKKGKQLNIESCLHKFSNQQERESAREKIEKRVKEEKKK